MFRDLLASRIPRPALATVAIVLGSLCIGLVSAGERVRQGNVSQPNSGAAEAQEVFLYGLAQLHNFQYDDASQLQRARPGILLQQPEGLILFSDSREIAGLNMLRTAAEAEAALPLAFGPPSIEQPGYELLGSALREIGQAVQARHVYALAVNRIPGRRLAQEGVN
jgi:hypothetical protein